MSCLSVLLCLHVWPPTHPTKPSSTSSHSYTHIHRCCDRCSCGDMLPCNTPGLEHSPPVWCCCILHSCTVLLEMCGLKRTRSAAAAAACCCSTFELRCCIWLLSLPLLLLLSARPLPYRRDDQKPEPPAPATAAVLLLQLQQQRMCPSGLLFRPSGRTSCEGRRWQSSAAWG